MSHTFWSLPFWISALSLMFSPQQYALLSSVASRLIGPIIQHRQHCRDCSLPCRGDYKKNIRGKWLLSLVKKGCGKVMFSVMSVCSGGSLQRVLAKTCSNLFNLDLTVQGPLTLPWTCSNLFTMKHGLSASGQLAFQ